jgi:hypothetical protein
VYSYYEFPQLRTERLADNVWLGLIGSSSVALPAWAEKFVTFGGTPVDVLAFRQGDIYRLTASTVNVSLYVAPSAKSALVRSLKPGDTVTIVDGPLLAEGLTWWKMRLASGTEPYAEGWVIEKQDWFERLWGQ